MSQSSQVPTPQTVEPLYVVQSGEYLSLIAEKLGVSLEDILAVNPEITNPDLIFAGQVLNLPPSAVPSNGSLTTPPVAGVSTSVPEPLPVLPGHCPEGFCFDAETGGYIVDERPASRYSTSEGLSIYERLYALGMTKEGAQHFLQTTGADVDVLERLPTEQINLVVEQFNKEGPYVVSGQMEKDGQLLKAGLTLVVSAGTGAAVMTYGPQVAVGVLSSPTGTATATWVASNGDDVVQSVDSCSSATDSVPHAIECGMALGNLLTPGDQLGPTGSTKSIPGVGYHKETTYPKPVAAKDAVDRWEEFLGPGPYTNIHPRTGKPDPNRIVSADGTRSIRYTKHDMNGNPTKHHYHEKTWTYDQVNNVMNVDNTKVRVPLRVPKRVPKGVPMMTED